MTRPILQDVTLVSWNAQVGRDPSDVVNAIRLMIRFHDPQVILLQEAEHYVRALRAAFPGWHVKAVRGWRESANNAQMIRRDIPLTRFARLRLKERWIGPNLGIIHPGRTYTHVTIPGWRFVNVHLPTGRRIGKNKQAWRESWRALARLADRPGSRSRALAYVGDWNALATEDPEKRPRSIPALADHIGGRVIRTSALLDYAVIRGCTCTRRETGSHYGSDHPSIVLRLERTTRKETTTT